MLPEGERDVAMGAYKIQPGYIQRNSGVRADQCRLGAKEAVQLSFIVSRRAEINELEI